MRALRSLAPIVVVASIVVGCDATSERAEDPRAVTPTTRVPTPARSPLADKVVELGSATYDPREHAARNQFPHTLSIDALGVDRAPIRPVGVAADGTMEIPGASEVGWYRFGAAPGATGSAVLAAHLAFDGVDGVFRDLADLDTGERIEVVMQDGTALAYRVERIGRSRKEQLAPDVWAKDGPHHLVLITCGGVFDPELRRYDSNIVVWAVPERADR